MMNIKVVSTSDIPQSNRGVWPAVIAQALALPMGENKKPQGLALTFKDEAEAKSKYAGLYAAARKTVAQITVARRDNILYVAKSSTNVVYGTRAKTAKKK